MLNRHNLDKYISDIYDVSADFPWITNPEYAVYRHKSSKKWFGVIMTVHCSKLGLEGDYGADIINLKCDPLLTGSLHKEKGIFPAYHMNKSYWISVLLDGSVDDELLKWLLNLSFELTKNTKAKKS